MGKIVNNGGLGIRIPKGQRERNDGNCTKGLY